jgi:hypothetical protein
MSRVARRAARVARGAARKVRAALRYRRAEGHLFPFVMPWDDASSGPTDLSGWNRPIEGETDRLRPGADGHLYRGTARVRLFGFNISSGAAFLDRAVGERIAGRLARLGVNYVRIAQNSMLAPDGWLHHDAAALDAEAVGRLDEFVAALRCRGVYVHLVLNHFRQHYPPQIPGFEARSTLPEGWPTSGTGVTAFYEPVVAANQALARELLTHRNPRTGLTYAEDPAVAVIEVSNEDGLVRTWAERELDPIIAGVTPHVRPLRHDLQARWNRWLQSRYLSDAALRAAWAEGASPQGDELIANGDFARGKAGWQLELRGGARGRTKVTENGPQDGARALEVWGARGGAKGVPVMVVQDRLRLEGGRRYRIGLWIRGAKFGGRIAVGLQQAHPPHRMLVARNVEWTLTDQWHAYSADMSVTESDAHARLTLIISAQPQTVSVAGVSLRRNAVSGLREGESAVHGTVPPFARATLDVRTPAAQRDWVAFLFQTEQGFFLEQFRFLRDDLGVRSLLVGTQGDYSPADAQRGSDVTSMHGYWSHPSFPCRPWDPTNWFVRNRSMTGARNEWHALNQIVFHRLLGKPLVVDEYNHPQPNTFGAEGFVLAAAYGGFQDWDGIAGWAYHEGWESRWLTQDDWARSLIRDYFSLDVDPARQLSAWVAAVAFRRGDVQPGTQLVLVGIGPGEEQEIARTVGLARGHEVIGRGAELLPLLHRVAAQPAAPPRPSGPPPLDETVVVSDTGELAWEAHTRTRGVVTIDSPRTKAVIGFGGGRVFSLGPVTLRPGPTAQRGFGVWAVTAMDGLAPVDSARRLIIVALGYSQNTNVQWAIYPDRQLDAGPPPEGVAVTLGPNWGVPPVLAEGMSATITLPATRGRTRVWALDERGQRRESLPVHARGGRPTVRIGARYRTLWYEVEVASDAP